MSLDVDAIEAQYRDARKRTEPHRCPWLYSAAVHLPALCAEVRRLREKVASLDGEGWGVPMTLAERLRAAATANRLAEHVTIDRRWNGVRFKGERRDLFRVINVDGQWVESLCGLGCCFDTDGLQPTREAAIRAGLLALAERLEAQP